MDEKQEKGILQEERLKAKAEKLKRDLLLAQKKLAKIRVKKQTEERRKRTRKLISVGGIFNMVNPELIETENDARLFRLITGTAVWLNTLLKSNEEGVREKLEALEIKAKEFLAKKDKGE